MENKIRVLIFSLTACALWLFLAYLAAVPRELNVARFVLITIIALFLTILSMGQGGKSDD